MLPCFVIYRLTRQTGLSIKASIGLASRGTTTNRLWEHSKGLGCLKKAKCVTVCLIIRLGGETGLSLSLLYVQCQRD